MNEIPIRSFRIDDRLFRHIIVPTNDDVFLEEFVDAQWKKLIRYDSSCCVWNHATSKHMGNFRTEDDHWFFYDTIGDRHQCEHTKYMEALLDSEVTVSRMFILTGKFE